MVEPYNVLSGSQTDINRRLLRMIEEMASGEFDDSELQAKIEALEARVEALENAS